MTDDVHSDEYLRHWAEAHAAGSPIAQSVLRVLEERRMAREDLFNHCKALSDRIFEELGRLRQELAAKDRAPDQGSTDAQGQAD